MMKLVTLIQQFQTGKKTKQNQKGEWIKQGRFSPFFML
jgi:hypothetical protein